MPERLTGTECVQLFEALGYFADGDYVYVTSNRVKGPKGFLFAVAEAGWVDAEILQRWLVDRQGFFERDVSAAISSVLQRRG